MSLFAFDWFGLVRFVVFAFVLLVLSGFVGVVPVLASVFGGRWL